METGVRIGLVGCGSFGTEHLRAFRKIINAKVVALYDPDTNLAQKRAQEFNIPRICDSLDELCHQSDIDAVDVVTPEHLHTEPVIKALKAGKHVFVEKPLATTVKDCEKMIAVAKETQRILMPGHILRFDAYYSGIRDAFKAKTLGRPFSMYARRNRPKSQLERYSRCHIGLINAIHDIDIMLWYMNSYDSSVGIKYVTGRQRKFVAGEHEAELFVGELHFVGGAIGRVETIWLLPNDSSARVLLPNQINIDDEFYLVDEKVGCIDLHPIGYDSALENELLYFCDCVRKNMLPSIITPEESLRAVKVTLAMIESARHGDGKERP